MQEFFHELGGTALLYQRGVFKTAPLYHRNNGIFVKFRGGFVRLNDNHRTAIDGLMWEEIQYDDFIFTVMGRLSIVPNVKNAKPIALAS